jgi:5'-nucleotidase / UDP-sugar diphosphatase
MDLWGEEGRERMAFGVARSAERGCNSQSQISGMRFVMDCAQAQLNELRIPCEPARETRDCPQENRERRTPWQCLADQDGHRCWAHPAMDIFINGQPLNPNGMYRVAVNDYIAKGGSGFNVLRRNTTRQETGISLRDSLIGYMQSFCNCDDINAGRQTSSSGERCGTLIDGQWVVAEQVRNFCRQAQEYQDALARKVGSCTCRELLTPPADAAERCGVPGLTRETIRATCDVPPGPYTGRCYCREALAGATECGSVTRQLESFCGNPTAMPIANALEDGRIGRRVK